MFLREASGRMSMLRTSLRLAVALFSVACSSDHNGTHGRDGGGATPEAGESSGGTSSTGGTRSSGGNSAGGATTGGAANGGASSGGATAGGAANGGQSSGGATSGGAAANGGESSGGMAATGGAANGGESSGGMAATGGGPTGGALGSGGANPITDGGGDSSDAGTLDSGLDGADSGMDARVVDAGCVRGSTPGGTYNLKLRNESDVSSGDPITHECSSSTTFTDGDATLVLQEIPLESSPPFPPGLPGAPGYFRATLTSPLLGGSWPASAQHSVVFAETAQAAPWTSSPETPATLSWDEVFGGFPLSLSLTVDIPSGTITHLTASSFWSGLNCDQDTETVTGGGTLECGSGQTSWFGPVEGPDGGVTYPLTVTGTCSVISGHYEHTSPTGMVKDGYFVGCGTFDIPAGWVVVVTLSASGTGTVTDPTHSGVSQCFPGTGSLQCQTIMNSDVSMSLVAQ